MIKRKTKFISICLAIMAFCFLGAIATIRNVDASSQTTGRFYMEDGASIRIADDYSGIRWKTVVEYEWFNENITENVVSANFGTLIAPKGTEISWENYKAQLETEDTADDMIVNIKVGYKQSAGDGEDTIYYSVINYNKLTENLEKAYALELEAVSYVVFNQGMDSEEFIEAERNDTCRSAKLVSNTSLYAGTVEDIDNNIAKAEEYQGEAETVELDEELAVELASAQNEQTVITVGAGENVDYVAIGAKKYTSEDYTINGDELTFNANVLAQANAGATNLALVYKDGSIKNYPFIVATQYIDEAEDLAIFGLGGYGQKSKEGYVLSAYTTVKGTKDSFKSQPGYYLVTKDIDASKYTHEFGAFPGNTYMDFYGSKDTDEYVNWRASLGENKDLKITVGEVKNFGLTGTFDGGGHRITGLTVAGYGLFGAVNKGAVIKDVAFIASNLGAAVEDTSSYVQGVHIFLAPSVYDATIENVYVQIASIKNAYGTVAGPAFADWMHGTSMTNCLIEWQAAPAERYINVGSFVRKEMTKNSFENVYVVSSAALSQTQSGSGETFVATPTYDGENTTATSKVAGVHRYESVSAMNTYLTTEVEGNKPIQAFDNSIWTIGNGMLQWGDTWVYATEKIESFSAYKDDAVITQTELQRVFGTTNTVELLSAIQLGGQAITVTKVENTNDYKVLGVQPNFIRSDSGHIDGVDYTPIKMTAIISGEEVDLAVPVKAYSRVIDEASDLKMFEAMAPVATTSGKWDFTNVEIFDGYYILKNNIDASSVTIDYVSDVKYSADGKTTGKGYTKWGSSARRYDYPWSGIIMVDGVETTFNYDTTGLHFYEMGMNGTFDGAGYTISGLKVDEYGLFPWVGEKGWIRNVAFDNIAATGWNQNSFTLATIINSGAKLSNVYLNGAVNSKTNAYKGLVAHKIASGATFENCIFYSPNDITSTAYFGSLMAETIADDGVFNPSTWSNVYVISSAVLCNKGGGTIYDASNFDVSLKVDCLRYESLDAMKSVNTDQDTTNDNDYSSFTKTEYWKLEGGMPVWANLPATN
ncbi:MAG: hypothetical protein E7373_06770 [Clostridiales bacterium]|nr:hypothetical protein [Clostridiales bacterium]